MTSKARKRTRWQLTSITSWCARAIKVKPFVWLNVSDISCPNVYPAPRGEIPQPPRSSGSDHKRSHIGPSCGTSWSRSNARMWSSVSIDGDKPPCRQNICQKKNKRTGINRLYVTCRILCLFYPRHFLSQTDWCGPALWNTDLTL